MYWIKKYHCIVTRMECVLNQLVANQILSKIKIEINKFKWKLNIAKLF